MQFVCRGHSSNTQVAEIWGFFGWRSQSVAYTEIKYADQSPPLEAEKGKIKE